jgi:hypothetical protein
MKCDRCDYEWEPRTSNPKACPRCKSRLDYSGRKSKDPLSEARKRERGFERTMYVMSVITPRLEAEGVRCVVVGGSAVEFYTRDWYATGDIDLAVTREKRAVIDRILRGLGFRAEGRMWVREDLALYIEIPGDVRDLDIDRVTRVETEVGYAFVIGLEDMILDRLSAAEHWKSESDREQAVRMAAMYYEKIDWNYVRKESRKQKTEKMLDRVMKDAGQA